jgi:DNA polymerase-3 subunit alpha
VEAIIQEREKNGKYKDIFDFVQRVNLQACNKKTIESLALAGGFDCFDSTYREQLLGMNSKGENFLDVLIRFGNKYQQDQTANSLSLFGDLGGGGGIDIQLPELPQVPRWSAIERLNKEKELIGIFLSAHPLDEWEFEVRELCNITADELTKFESWRKPESRANATIKDDDDEQTNEVRQTPNEWIQEHTDKTLHIGGIVVSSEELISQKGNPYGRYVIEDYSGSYQFSAFGETYKQYASLLKQNVYVYLTGVIQQKGAHMKWFKPKPIEDAEFEFSLQQVQLIEDAQKHLNSLTLQIPIEQIQPDLIDELTEMTQQHAGLTPLRVNIFDETKQNLITFNAHPIKIDSSFYHWLKMQKLDNIFYYKVN